ncbi:MAG TPA: translation initiation factor IF-2 [bacterium]|nr:translation initiation factor IF-2 [bacterium]
MDNNKITNIHRPPVVVVMGHIDHGKSELLDYIRKTNAAKKTAKGEPHPVVGQEAGGITQCIGAYEIDVKGKRITFLDTPGHEAFSKMRSRGAKIADIAILVIAADEGVKPQTLEAYKKIKKEKIPFTVAINKIDKPEANSEQVKAQLAENQIFVENHGGEIPAIDISAKTGQGINELLDMVLLLAEMENLTANFKENASGTVIESHLDSKRGVAATLLVKNGTMKKGMFVVCGGAIAPVRIFEDFRGNSLEQATFSSPVKIIGFDKIPEVGAEFKTFNTKKEAETVRTALEKTQGVENAALAAKNASVTERDISTENIQEEKIIIPIIIKADTAGSVEAVEKEIMKLQDEETFVDVLRKGVGNISENDIRLASSAKNPIALGFNVGVDASAGELIEKFSVTIQTSDIIYKISEWLDGEIKKRKLLIPREEMMGKAEILKTFSKIKNKQLVGGRVLEGKITDNASVKIKRKDFEIGQGKIIEIQQNKVKAREVGEGKEFGIIIESKSEIAKGDLIEIVKKIG